MLLDGTVENVPAGYASVIGQTLAEERLAYNGGGWPAKNGVLDDSVVNGHDRPLFGRQQLERLLAEFRAVMAKTKMEAPAVDEVMCSMGGRKALANPADLADVAAALAKSRIDSQIVPLVVQFHHRVTYCVLRISDTVAALNRLPKKNAGRGRFTAGAGDAGGGAGGGMGSM
jgi:hypothetical protein